jgi:hypothetical protein
MYDALKGANKDVQLVKLKDEDQWLSRSGTRAADAASLSGLSARAQRPNRGYRVAAQRRCLPMFVAQ